MTKHSSKYYYSIAKGNDAVVILVQYLYNLFSLSEFNSLVKDIQETLSYVLDYEEDMAEMYLTHYSVTG